VHPQGFAPGFYTAESMEEGKSLALFALIVDRLER
jgi:hypothetical protein